jgi:hypothetical protein
MFHGNQRRMSIFEPQQRNVLNGFGAEFSFCCHQRVHRVLFGFEVFDHVAGFQIEHFKKPLMDSPSGCTR